MDTNIITLIFHCGKTLLVDKSLFDKYPKSSFYGFINSGLQTEYRLAEYISYNSFSEIMEVITEKKTICDISPQSVKTMQEEGFLENHEYYIYQQMMTEIISKSRQLTDFLKAEIGTFITFDLEEDYFMAKNALQYNNNIVPFQVIMSNSMEVKMICVYDGVPVYVKDTNHMDNVLNDNNITFDRNFWRTYLFPYSSTFRKTILCKNKCDFCTCALEVSKCIGHKEIIGNGVTGDRDYCVHELMDAMDPINFQYIDKQLLFNDNEILYIDEMMHKSDRFRTYSKYIYDILNISLINNKKEIFLKPKEIKLSMILTTLLKINHTNNYLKKCKNLDYFVFVGFIKIGN